MRAVINQYLFLTVAVLTLGVGCSTFKYTPKHDQIYTSIGNRSGLAIRTGLDSRSEEEKRPNWTKNAEKIVALALADEVKHAKLFARVKMHADSVSLKKYSEIVGFRVIKFECNNQPAFLETTGRKLLRFQGIQGALIAESIPTKYVSKVEIEFTVLSASTQQSIFVKTYSASRSFIVNGYQGSSPKVQKTSAALEAVITQFVADLTRLP